MHFESRSKLMLELGFNPKRLDALKSYVDLLWKSNEELNLISRKMSFEELIDNHVIDALLALRHFPLNAKSVADFGSGGGIPGVIFALHFQDTKFTLFEKSAKKRDFLKLCQNLAANVHIEGEIPKQMPSFDLVTARAFKPIDVILDISRHYYKNGGRYFLLKGRREKIEEEIQESLKTFKEIKPKIVELKSPILEVERHLIIL